MKPNSISAAFDQVDVEPSPVFRSDLRALFINEMTQSDVPATVALVGRSPALSPAESTHETGLVTIQSEVVEAHRHRWRLPRIALAAAASIALVLAAAVIVRHNSEENTGSELHDVDPAEALPLAQNAFITADVLGSRWRNTDMFTESMYSQQTAATIAARPECAELTSMGLFTPTTKSVAARQSFSPGRNYVGHTVFVFATKQDASRAMDAIAGGIYRVCWFDLFDRLVPLGSTLGTDTSTSEAWDPPAITRHGDRQIIIGQQATLIGTDATVHAYFVNAYVQVGRAISWINPMTGPSPDTNLFAVNKAIEATATALNTTFGS